MSGDVQTRKRKEKKRKKDESNDESQHLQKLPAKIAPVPIDVAINTNVHKDSGGGFCAKIVFFILLTALAVLIGLIITEHRGLTDVDNIKSDSKFSRYFDSWVEKSPSDEHDDDLEDNSEEQLYSQEENEVSQENAEDDLDSNEENTEEDEEDNEDDNEKTEEDDDEEIDERTDEDEEEEIDEKTDEDEEEEDEYQEMTKENEDESEEIENEKIVDENEDDSKEDEKDENISDEDKSKDKEDDDSDEEDEKEDEGDEIVKRDTDDKVSSSEKRNFVKKEEDSLEGENDDTENVSNEINDEDSESAQAETKSLKDIISTLPVGTTYVMIKFGVGAGIVVVAYVVLVKKWKNEKEDEETPVEKTQIKNRRNTIVTPPRLEEVEPDIQPGEERVNDDKADYYENSDSENYNEPNSAKKKYQELQTTYSKTLDDDSGGKTDAQKPNYEDEEEWDDEEDDEEEEDEDDEDGYDIYDNDDDDEELLKKLEAKYGKLHHKQSDEDLNKEESEEDDDEDIDYEEDSDDYESNTADKPEKHNRLMQEEKTQPDSSTTPKEKRQESESDKVMDITQNEFIEEQKPESDNKEEFSGQDTNKDLDSGIHHISESDTIEEFSSQETNKDLDDAINHISDDPAYALQLITKLLEKNPSSLKALYGKAQALNSLAAKKKSNTLLEEAISTYLLVLQSQEISNEMYKEVAEKCIDRMRFRGYFGKAISVHKSLIDKFPDSLEYKYQLVITYLTINRIREARQLLQKILAVYPDDGFALVHYGFILKTVDNDFNKSVEYLRKGISTKAQGVIDGRFYFHLGDALTKLGRIDEAQQVYVEGVDNKLFLSKYQRSLYNVDRLKAKPFWNKKETPYVDFFNMLEKNWQNIRDEGMALLNDAGYFEDESENLRDVGEWKQLELFARGIKKKKNCQSCPFTCSLVERLPDARYCRRGQVKFSVMHPGTHVWPHCGPTNCRLRAHLGLKVPNNTFIRVCDEIRSWSEGKILIFDDSFEHEVWHNGTEIRMVLIIDLWHPELSEHEKRSLPAI